MANKSINIAYPFKDSVKGFFLDLTTTDDEAVKSDLMHLLLTRKGQRLYNPDFGTDLLKFIFEPNDSKTLAELKTEIITVVKRYLPNLDITGITVEESSENEYSAIVTIKYNISDAVFTKSDLVIINL